MGISFDSILRLKVSDMSMEILFLNLAKSLQDQVLKDLSLRYGVSIFSRHYIVKKSENACRFSDHLVQFWPLSLCHAIPALHDTERGARTRLLTIVLLSKTL